ncbi:MAG: hypothetical protein ACKPE6_14305 [Gammaproteobacteria bacterium]
MRALRRVMLLLPGFAIATALQAAPIVPPSIGAGFKNSANAGSPLGTNIASPTDYTREYPFINHFKMARSWFPSSATQFDCRANEQCTAAQQVLDRDARGNIRRLATGQFARSVIFTGSPADPGVANRTWNFQFDGDGDFEFGGVQGQANRTGPRSYVFKTQAIPAGADRNDIDLMVTITMTRNNPQNPVKNVRLLPAGGICRANPLKTVASKAACVPDTEFRSFAANHKTIVFNPAFLGQIKTYRSLRFMDWMKTNNSLTRDFATRPVPDDQFWNSDDSFNGSDEEDPFNCNMLTRGCKGVPLEVMFALANLMDMDPWFNIPHLATTTDTASTESYVKQFAKMLNTHLESGRKAYIEYSNEVWNFQFAQSNFAFEEANSCGAGGDAVCPEFETSVGQFGGESDPGSAFVRFYSKRAQDVFRVFDQVLGTSRPNKIRRVMASQAVNPYFTDQILDFQDGAALTDVFAIAPYIGDTLTDFDDDFTPEDDRFFYANCGTDFDNPATLTRRQAFLEAGADGIFDWLNDVDGAPDLGYGSISCAMDLVRQQAEVAADYDVPLTSYEGGQHFLLSPVNFFTEVPEEIALNELFDDVNRDPRMQQLYLNYLNAWRSATDTDNTSNGITLNKPLVAPNGAMFHHFSNSDRWSPFGRWGSKEFPTQTSSMGRCQSVINID